MINVDVFSVIHVGSVIVGSKPNDNISFKNCSVLLWELDFSRSILVSPAMISFSFFILNDLRNISKFKLNKAISVSGGL